MRFMTPAMRRWTGGAIATLVAATAQAQAQAQAWPARPIRMIVPFAPGGTTDIVARLVAKALGESTGQPVVVENRIGAGGNVGSAVVAKAAPDGCTLLVVPAGNFSINQYLYRTMPYAPSELVGVALLAQVPNLLMVNAKSPFTTVAQLVAHAKAHPGAVEASSAGNGTTTHLALELFKTMAGVDILHVPYNGSSASRMELLSGRVQMTFDNLASYMPDVKQGSVRVLATAGPRRTDFLPDVPTLDESGLKGYAANTWFALGAPSGTPPAVVDAISRQVNQYLRTPEALAALRAQGAEPMSSTPASTAAFIEEESVKWKKVVEISKARVE